MNSKCSLIPLDEGGSTINHEVTSRWKHRPKHVFKRNYQSHLKHLKLKGLQPKTIEAYSRAIRRIGERFDHQIDSLTEQQLTDYFTELVASHSWSTVKLDLYGLQVLLRACLAQALGGARSDQAAQEPALAGHRHGRGSPADIRRHPRAQLPGVLLHAL